MQHTSLKAKKPLVKCEALVVKEQNAVKPYLLKVQTLLRLNRSL